MFTRLATKVGGTLLAVATVAAFSIGVSLLSSNSIASSPLSSYEDHIYGSFISKGYERKQAELLTLFFKNYKAINGEYPTADSLEFTAKNMDLQFPFLTSLDQDSRVAFLTLIYEYGSSIYTEIPNFMESFEKGNKLEAQSSLRSSNYCIQNYGICSAVDAALFYEQ